MALNVPVSALVKLPIAMLIRENRPKSEKWPGLILEVTEDQIVRDIPLAHEIATQLKIYNIVLAIDDFGTGYSSFAWLRQFPLNELKIDRSFVRELDAGGDDGRTARALIELAHAFRIRALAECVESAETASALAAAGCDRAQGFRFSPAMPPQALVAWCRRHDEATLLSSSAEPEFQ
jgi:EAL domain-containing protein (putative c-di-GMP-specific phosphodiesterase class I)